MCRQSMQTKAMAPSRVTAAIAPRLSDRNVVNACSDVSPAAMANSRWRTAPEPQTWPSMGTL